MKSPTADYEREFTSRVMDAWPYRHGIPLDFIRPGKPVKNGFIKSFNARLWDGCLKVEVFFTLDDVHGKLARWQKDDNLSPPYSSLQDQAPVPFAAEWLATEHTEPSALELLETRRHPRELW